MALTLAGAGLIGAGINALGDIATNVTNSIQAHKTRVFNREEAEKNREFQREMAQNNIKYAIQQAKDLGISPSMILGQQTHALGGSQASVSGGQANYNMSGITSATNNLINTMKEDQRIKSMEEMNEDRLQTMKEMNEDRLQTMKEIQQMKMQNSTTNSKYENYKKRNNINSDDYFYTDLNKIKI